MSPADRPNYPADQPRAPRPRRDADVLTTPSDQHAHPSSALPARIVADPERVEQDLAKLVLTLIELIRRLMERQAIRRIEAGSVSDEQVERMGETFMKLDQKMTELTTEFGLDRADLNLYLGVLGDLM